MAKREQIPVVQTEEPDSGSSLYTARKHIQIRHIGGKYGVYRDLGMYITMALYFGLPWLMWDGRQAILFNLPDRRFDLFGLSMWPQDFLFLAWSLMLAAFALFFFTVLAGRVYCGYVCPQTTWTRLFTLVERLCEGDRHQRIRLDNQPMSANKLLRKSAKHLLWLGIALSTALTFVGYFYPIRELIPDFLAFDLNGWAWFWMAFFVIATYGNAGFMREQVCTYMCPYARFQSVMFDADTMIVSYDAARGEPRHRGKHRAEEQADEKVGDCIDCSMCVQVCPTGIDIRDGLQLECITCAACIDACDEVMEKIHKPKGLIRYTTEHALEGAKSRILRPRLLGYGLVLLTLLGLFAWRLNDRVPLQVDVIRDRNQLYRITSMGDVENSYRLEILNKDQQPHRFVITLEGDEVLKLVNGPVLVSLQSGEHRSVPVTVSYDPYAGEPESGTIWFNVRVEDDPTAEVRHESRFIKPR